MSMAKNKKVDYVPLFETKASKGRLLYYSYAVSMLIGIVLILIHRIIISFPQEKGLKRWTWTGLFISELWYIFYWFLNQSVRLNPIHRYTFKDRLSQRYEKVLPSVDIFVCTADDELEPPVMVIDTVLSVMAYDYPPEKLNVYLSDDGGSELMFYAMWEASMFSKFWLPFCRKFNVEPRAPSAYFSSSRSDLGQEWRNVKKLYDEMKGRINDVTRLRRVPDDQRMQHEGFKEWQLNVSKKDHQTILEVLINGKDTEELDIEGKRLPTLVYLARERRPGYGHNFKAGAMNALIRVSSKISNSPIILNVDCDMYSNNSQSIRDVLCFFMDEKQSHNVAYVQYPQMFSNITKNDMYASHLRVIIKLEFPGIDANGGPLYIGSGCFHRRDVLCGKRYDHRKSNIDWDNGYKNQENEKNLYRLIETCKILAGCSYEENSAWGKEMGLKYGCAVEDVITGLSIKCRGWRSIWFDPTRHAFVGSAPNTLLAALIQHTRWGEGHLQIFLSKYCPFVFGRGKIPLKLQMSYCCYNLWAANCLATLYYVVVPSFCLLKGINLYPKLSSKWAQPYLYVAATYQAYSLWEFLQSGGTTKEWWNNERMWLYKRLTSYLYALHSTVMRYLGLSKLSFAITSKTADDDVSRRFENEIMEFGASSSMFVVLSTVALFNLFAFSVWIAKNVGTVRAGLETHLLQIVLSGSISVINLPLFEAAFVRKDKGSMPVSVTTQSVLFAGLACALALY